MASIAFKLALPNPRREIAFLPYDRQREQMRRSRNFFPLSFCQTLKREESCPPFQICSPAWLTWTQDTARTDREKKVAVTNPEQSLGLMYRKSMDEEAGMVFLWPEGKKRVLSSGRLQRFPFVCLFLSLQARCREKGIAILSYSIEE